MQVKLASTHGRALPRHYPNVQSQSAHSQDHAFSSIICYFIILFKKWKINNGLKNIFNFHHHHIHRSVLFGQNLAGQNEGYFGISPKKVYSNNTYHTPFRVIWQKCPHCDWPDSSHTCLYPYTYIHVRS